MEYFKATLNILVDVEKPYIPKSEYVFRQFCRILGLQPKFYYRYSSAQIHVYYGEKADERYPVHIYHNPQANTFFSKKEMYPNDEFRFQKYNEVMLPFLFSSAGEIFEIGERCICISKDIISSAFYFLTCWQEYASGQKLSPENRYDFQESHQKFWDFADIPVVDYYVDMLDRAFSMRIPEFSGKPRWPENKDFCMTLSHDVDYWNYWTPEEIKRMNRYNLGRFTKQPLKSMYKMLFHNLDKRLFYNPTRRHSRVIAFEHKHSVQSTSFLLAMEDNPDPRKNYVVDPEYRTEIQNFYTLLNQTGAELHASPEAAFSLEQLDKELGLLREMGFHPIGSRSHRLAFSFQETFAILEKAGILYDSTLGYWEHAGYRAGISFPFKPFNLSENRPFNILEIPMHVMDVSLFSPIAMNQNFESGRRWLLNRIKHTRKQKGHLSLLWHYRTFDNIDYPGWGNLYKESILRAKKNNGWICSFNELYKYWTDK